MTFLASLSDSARDELDALIDARIAAALAARDREPNKRWLSVPEAAVYLGVSARSIYTRCQRGRIPQGAIRHVGRRLLIDRQALDCALERT